MLTVNCSMRMTVHNPVFFSGIYVSSKSVNLMYSEVTVVTGELKKYHQQRKSRRTVSVNIQGSKVSSRRHSMLLEPNGQKNTLGFGPELTMTSLTLASCHHPATKPW